MPYKVGYLRPSYRLTGKRLGLEKMNWGLIPANTLEDRHGVMAVCRAVESELWVEKWGACKYSTMWVKGEGRWEQRGGGEVVGRTFTEFEGSYLVVELDNYWGLGVVALLRPSKVAWGKFELHFYCPSSNKWVMPENDLFAHGSARDLIDTIRFSFNIAGYR